MSGGRARGQNIVHLQNEVFLLQSFLEVHILTTIYQEAFILRPYVPCRVLFHSMTSDPRVNGHGWGSRSESSISLKCGISVFISYLYKMYPVGFALIPCHRTPGSLPGGWARGQILVHLENVVILL